MATDPEEYWRRRRELSPSPSPERPVVADGDRQLAVVVDVDEPAVVEAYGRLRDRLGGFDCFRPTPPDALHLSVKLFDHAAEPRSDGGERPGSAPTSTRTPTRTSTSLDRIDAALTDVAAAGDPFTIAFPRLNLFPDAVYAEVDADGALTALNSALCAPDWAATSGRDAAGFIPHLTLGYFVDDADYDRLVDSLEAEREPSLPTTTVTGLSLVARDVTSAWRSSATTLATYPL
jgi:2'-5' RNA ligase